MPSMPPMLIRSVCAALLLLAASAWADVGRDGAAAAAQQASGGGRVLSVDRADGGGRAMWRVKVVTAKGEVRVILVDAASGRAQ
jgi:hypothetical protein